LPTHGAPPARAPHPRPLDTADGLGESFDMVEMPGARSAAWASTISTGEADRAEAPLEATVCRRQ
jgi:hypothetical protein